MKNMNKLKIIWKKLRILNAVNWYNLPLPIVNMIGPLAADITNVLLKKHGLTCSFEKLRSVSYKEAKSILM